MSPPFLSPLLDSWESTYTLTSLRDAWESACSLTSQLDTWGTNKPSGKPEPGDHMVANWRVELLTWRAGQMVLPP